jgi:hypothetical protein
MDCPLRHRAAQVRLLSACLALSFATAASAELPWSRLDALFPAGAKAGTSIQMRLTGSELENTTSLRFSHPGITATRVPGSSPAENLFQVQVAAETPPGLYDVTAAGDLGLSNARTFAVGQRNELTESEPNDVPATATTVSVGSTINGRIAKATDVDSYSFRAAAGQKLVADCLATRIDSPLLPVLEILDPRGRRVAFARSGRDNDAILVFEPTVEADYTLRVYDQTYRGGDDFVYRLELHADPHVVAIQPVVGKAGSKSNVQILGLNLPGAQPSDQKWGRWPLLQAEASIEFPQDRLSYDRILPVTPREAATDSFAWRFTSQTGPSQPVRIKLSDVDAVREVEPNQHRDQAQRLTLPAEISGSFGSYGDVDLFRVDVKKDEPIWVEVFADRLGSKADAAIRIDFIPEGATDPTRVASVDDVPGDLLPLAFETHSDDPSFRFQPTANGTCLIQVRDQYGQTRGDASLVYQLVVRNPQPDFRLVAVPTSRGIGMIAPASLRKGDAVEFTVVAFRQDGFDGPIEVPATDLGGGLFTDGTLILKGQSTSRLVIRSQTNAEHLTKAIELTGQATIPKPDGAASPLVRPVRPATTLRSTAKIQTRDIPATARLAREFVVGIATETAPIEIRHELARQSVHQGASLDVPLKLTRRAGAEAAITVAVQGLPKAANVDAADITFAPGETEKVAKLTVRADAPVQPHIINWIARTKVQYRPNASQREEVRLALENVTSRLKVATDDAKTADAESTKAEQALTSATKTPSDTNVDLGPLEAAKVTAAKRVSDAAGRVKQLDEERLASEKRLQELDKAVKELDTSAVTSPLILDVQPAPHASPPTTTN